MSKEYVRKKPVISGTISPLHKKKIDRLVESGEFASISDFINQAVSDLLKKYESDASPAGIADHRFTEEEWAVLHRIIREESARMDFEKQN